VISRCVGLAPATLRKAEALIDALECDATLKSAIAWMDERYITSGHVRYIIGVAHRDIVRRKAYVSRALKRNPMTRRLGRHSLGELLANCQS
jgi:hypothetical protein